jgi:hypothetical protein
VPKATMVNPMTKLETLYLFASPEAPPTNQSAPLIRVTNPSVRSRMFTIVHIGVSNFLLHYPFSPSNNRTVMVTVT